MIPTLLILGLVIGLLIHDRVSFRRAVAAGVAASLLWGVAVLAGDAEAGSAAGGVVLALANTAVGVAVGATTRAAWGAARRPRRRRAASG